MKREFNINQVEYVVIKAIKGKIKLVDSPKLFINLDKDIRKFAKEYNKKFLVVKRIK